ncbi:MAG: dihydrolipoyl dehydrogenase [Actinobacteria bacterium]|nr:dihydrolipoyl dehydrogenase [Actinomycetota bacterium]
MNTDKNFDLAVLGGGPGGYVASIRASKLGLKTAVIEKDYLGGVCLNCGCIPTKTLYHVAFILEEIKKAKNFGIDVSLPKLDFKKTMARKDQIIEMNRKSLQFHFKKNNIELIKGRGEIIAAGKIAVRSSGNQDIEIEAKNIIIATGSSAANVKSFDLSEDGIMDNIEILSLKEIPESLLIIGGGVIGSEFANIFSSFGTKVTIVEMLPRILSTEYEEVSKVIYKVFRQKGIDIFTDTVVEKVEKSGKSSICTTSSGEIITADKVLISVGRKPNSTDIGIEKVGVEVDQKGYIKVDSHLKTNVEGIYAVGDVIGGLQLAHVASKEGKIAAENIAGKIKEMNYNIIPWAVFTSPEIGTVGLNPEQAKEKGYNVCMGNFPFSSNSRAYITGETEGFINIVTDKDTGEILGAQMIGPRASELVHEVAVAMNAEVPVDDLATTVHSHPTLSEAVMEAAEDCFDIATHKA